MNHVATWVALALLLGNAITGMTLDALSLGERELLRTYALGLLAFRIGELPANTGVVLHLLLVAVLIGVFPFSKLLHAPGVFFSPTRIQPDNARERRAAAAVKALAKRANSG